MAASDHHRHASEHIFRSRLPDIDIPSHLSLPQFVFQNLSLYPNNPCIIELSTGLVYSYSDAQRISQKVASGLVKLGILQGDVVMLLLPNCAEFVLLFLGIAARGAVVTTANPSAKPAEIRKQARAAGVKLIITQAEFVEKLAKLRSEEHIRILTIDEPVDGLQSASVLLSADENECPDFLIDPNDVVALPFSSGTSGLPKGVMLTHKSVVTGVAQLVDGENPNIHYSTEDVVLCMLPLIHIFSISVLLCSLRSGSAVAIMQKFDVIAVLQHIQTHRITITAVVPPIVLAITKCPMVDQFDTSSLRKIQSGAATLGKELEDAFRAVVPNAVIGQGYGMTEAGPVLTMTLSLAKIPTPAKPGSCGTVVRNAQMKIVDTETGVSLPINHPGEIYIRGAQIMKGYLNDPESTALAIDQDGWLRTGDIGYVDEDNEVFIVDRVKEIIKHNGYQVPPAELEALLLSHPAIHDVAVVPEPDEASGELPVAFVVKAHGCDITENEIKQYVAAQVVFYKRVRKVYFIDAIPKSPNGKILRRELKSKLANAVAEAARKGGKS